jgi:hypothetical protein
MTAFALGGWAERMRSFEELFRRDSAGFARQEMRKREVTKSSGRVAQEGSAIHREMLSLGIHR